MTRVIMNVNEIVETAEKYAAAAENKPDEIASAGTWRPSTISDIEWALECKAESEVEIAQIDTQLADLIRRAEARAAKLKESALRRSSYFEARIAEFAEKHRDDGFLVGTKKSRDFISGRIGWRKKSGRLRVDDKDALAAWAGTQDGLYRVTVSPDMKAIQEHHRQTGEIPPGCVYEEERDEIYIEAVSLALEAASPFERKNKP